MPVKLMIVDDEPADLRRLEQHDVALLITDRRLPGVNGTERLEMLRLTRADMARVREMTTEVVSGRCDGVAA